MTDEKFLGSGDPKASYILSPELVEVLNDALETAWYEWQKSGNRGTDDLNDLMGALGWKYPEGQEPVNE